MSSAQTSRFSPILAGQLSEPFDWLPCESTQFAKSTAPLIGLGTVGAWADGLPTNLLLKCEDKVSIIITGVPFIPDAKFETMLRLKDGELLDTDSIWLTTKGCELRNSIV